jgi:hypothetical protein
LLARLQQKNVDGNHSEIIIIITAAATVVVVSYSLS